MRPFLLAAAVLLAVGIANIDVKETRIVKVPVTRTIRSAPKVKVKIVRISEPAPLADGYMTTHQCDTIGRDAGFRTIVGRYGWPAGDSGSDSYAGMLYYPLSDDRKHDCVVDFWRNRVDHVTIERGY